MTHSARDKLSEWKRLFHKESTPWKNYMKPSEIVYNKTLEKYRKKDNNIVKMLQTIQKLKSAVTIIVEAWSHHNEDDLGTQIKLNFW